MPGSLNSTLPQVVDAVTNLLEETLKRKSRVPNDQIESLQKTLITCLALSRSLINTHSAIDCLPLEILSGIFELVRISSGPPSPRASANGFIGSQLPPNQWIAVTHVCRSWRKVAHDTPTLWTDIHTLTNRDSVDYFLARSSSLPITLTCGYVQGQGNSPPPKLWSNCDAATGALRTLCRTRREVHKLRIHSTFPMETILQKDKFSRVVLSGISQSQLSRRQASSGNQGDLLTNFLSMISPSLREISLHGISVSHFLDAPIRCTILTHLALYEQPGFFHTEGPLKGSAFFVFLDILRVTSSTLQTLILVGAGPSQHLEPTDDSSGSSNEQFVVSLPALQYLEIGGWKDSGRLAHFLAYLRFSGSTTRCIWGADMQYLSSILFSMDIKSLRTKQQRGWDTSIRSIVMSSVSPVNMVGLRHQTIYIQGAIDFTYVYPLFRDHPHIFAEVEELYLTPVISQLYPSPEGLRSLCLALPNLKKLSCKEFDITPVLLGLGLLYNEAGDELTGKVPVPHLEEIDIEYSDGLDPNGNPRTKDIYGREFTDTVTMLISLVKFAEKRVKLNSPLTTVRIHFGGTPGRHADDCFHFVDVLRRFVNEVETDELTTFNLRKGRLDVVSPLLSDFWPTLPSIGSF